MISRAIKIGFLFFTLIGANQAYAAMSAEEVVEKTASGVIERIKQEKDSLKTDPDKLYALIDELVIPSFDFILMSRWVLGESWKSASDEQRTQFVEEFKTLLVNTYAKALLEYSNQEVKFYPAEPTSKPNLAVVRTELTSDGATAFPVTYRMFNKNEQWKVIDVSVDGVSLVKTYQGSFATQIKKSGFDSLLQQLADKNAKLETNLKAGS
ncbi:MAG: ABC transporter substrate-binding protein [Pseudomonadota bacterium]